jgi:hypothetical protein
MGIKSRGNWNINFCIKSDCVNRDFECTGCTKFSKYNINLKLECEEEDFWESITKEKK